MDDKKKFKLTETQTGLKISIRRNSILREVSIDAPLQLNGPADENTGTEMAVDQPNDDIPKVSQPTNDIPGNSATISNENNESEIKDYEYDTNDEPEPDPGSEHEQNQTISIVLPPFAMNGLPNSVLKTIPPKQTNQPSQNTEESDDENISIDLDGEMDVDIEIRPKKPIIRLPPFAAKIKSKRKPKPEQMPKKADEKCLGIEIIVPNICFPFLRNGCVEGENCYYPHEFPTTDAVYERIVECGPENAATLFHVIVARCPSLLERYYETFVEFFALHLRRLDLIKTIAICERDNSEDNKKKKFRYLVKAFVQSGLSYQLTIRTILTGLNDVNIANITVLLDLRIVNGTTLNDLFEVLQALVIDTEFIFKPAIGNFLLTVCNRHNELKLVHLVKNLFRPSNRHRMIGVEDHLLRQFHQKFIQNRMLNGQRQNGRRPDFSQPNGQRRQNHQNRATRGRNIFSQRSNRSI